MIDFSKYAIKGKNRMDLNALFRDVGAFDAAIQSMAEPFRAKSVSAVAALDALGFVFGTAIARELGCGLILVRKGGKLPVECESTTFVDYSGDTKTFEIARGVIFEGDTVLIVDEWSSTGAQLEASALLIEKMGGVVIGAACYSMNARVKANPLLSKYVLHSLLVSESTM